ncbi:MAG: hypothetical protein OEM28_01485 [Nitrosopumilus sp.]|nr:hypothetical protein [Nitrosopumilus sp.]MDH3486540.1 hypothetical protein [Nitrosopumilus sp.]
MELETQIISLQNQLLIIQLVPDPQGLQGDSDPQGPPGPLGPSTTYIMHDFGSDGTYSIGNTILEVECLLGDIATGGGAGHLAEHL